MKAQQAYPMYYWMLNDVDKYRYNYLRFILASAASKNQRNMRITNFHEAIEQIKCFVIRGDNDDKLRSFVAGICWLNDGIAVNTHQLKALLGKCKSSINGSLQKMGYAQSVSRAEALAALTNYFPFLKDNSAELRKWSVRSNPSKEVQYQCSPPAPQKEVPQNNSQTVSISVQGEKPVQCVSQVIDYTEAMPIDELDAFDSQWDDSFSFWE